MSLLDFLTTNTTASGGPLTEEDFFAAMRSAMRALERSRPAQCPPHLISSRAEPGSFTLCSWCYGPVMVPPNWRR